MSNPPQAPMPGQPRQPEQGAPQPRKSNTGLWIGLGAVLAVALIVGILLLTGVFGGGKYAGDKTPELPPSFGSWKKQPESVTGDSPYVVYTDGVQGVSVLRSLGNPDTLVDQQESEVPPEFRDQVKKEKPDNAVSCYAHEEKRVAACAVRYKDGIVGFFGPSLSVNKEAALAFAKEVK